MVNFVLDNGLSWLLNGRNWLESILEYSCALYSRSCVVLSVSTSLSDDVCQLLHRILPSNRFVV